MIEGRGSSGRSADRLARLSHLRPGGEDRFARPPSLRLAARAPGRCERDRLVGDGHAAPLHPDVASAQRCTAVPEELVDAFCRDFRNYYERQSRPESARRRSRPWQGTRADRRRGRSPRRRCARPLGGGLEANAIARTCVVGAALLGERTDEETGRGRKGQPEPGCGAGGVNGHRFLPIGGHFFSPGRCRDKPGGGWGSRCRRAAADRRLRDDRPGRVRARLLRRARRRPRPARHSPVRTVIRPASAACLRAS